MPRTRNPQGAQQFSPSLSFSLSVSLSSSLSLSFSLSLQGGDVVNLEVLVVGVLGVRNSSPEDVDGLSEVHRRGEKEVPGEEPLFRQRAAWRREQPRQSRRVRDKPIRRSLDSVAYMK
ncbi:unnamed protein product [Gadus morhua 'NCC']